MSVIHGYGGVLSRTPVSDFGEMSNAGAEGRCGKRSFQEAFPRLTDQKERPMKKRRMHGIPPLKLSPDALPASLLKLKEPYEDFYPRGVMSRILRHKDVEVSKIILLTLNSYMQTALGGDASGMEIDEEIQKSLYKLEDWIGKAKIYSAKNLRESVQTWSSGFLFYRGLKSISY